MPRRSDQVAELRIELAAQATRLAVLEAALAERTKLVALKAAARDANVPYEAARRLCSRQLVNSKKIGGRVFANPNDLVLHARRKV
jgi:hypothetical protein